MCLAIPARVVAVEDDDMATVAVEGISKRISLALVDEVAVGEYVLVHVGYALHRISDEEAQETLALMAHAGMLDAEIDELADDDDAARRMASLRDTRS